MNDILQKIPGLYQAVKRLREQAGWNRLKAKAADTDPRIAHEADLEATKDEKAADKAEAMARSNVAIINTVELLIHHLKESTLTSADRTLAMRDLEMASMRLRRELGEFESAGI